MQFCKLRDICALRQWKALPKRFFTQEGYPVYGANGIIGRYSHYNHQQPTIAITCRGDTCGQTHYTEPYSYVTANALCAEDIRADIMPLYLYYYLKQADFRPYITGAAQPQLTKKTLGEMLIPTPTIEQQRHIVENMLKAERVWQLRQQQLKALCELKTSYYARTFGSMQQARRVRLEEVATIHTGRHNANAATAEGAYPFFTCAHQPRRIDRYSFDAESVILAGNIDFHVSYFKGKFDAYQRTYVICAREGEQLSVPYLYAFLEHSLPQLEQQALGGVIKYIRRPMLSEMRIPIPPLDEQLHIGNFALTMQKARKEMEQAAQREHHIQQEILAHLFSTSV